MSKINDFKEWYIIDNYPNEILDQILPISEKVKSLLARTKNKLNGKEGAINICGAIQMMEGMDYHFSNFKNYSDANEINKIHEIHAYLNRMGQFYYFGKSEYAKKLISNPMNYLSNIIGILQFRMKVTSHRSLDFPKNESSYSRENQAFSLMGVQTFKDQHGNDQYIITLEQKEKNGLEHVIFNPITDHPKIMNECYNLMEKLINKLAN